MTFPKTLLPMFLGLTLVACDSRPQRQPDKPYTGKLGSDDQVEIRVKEQRKKKPQKKKKNQSEVDPLDNSEKGGPGDFTVVPDTASPDGGT